MHHWFLLINQIRKVRCSFITNGNFLPLSYGYAIGSNRPQKMATPFDFTADLATGNVAHLDQAG